MDPIFLTRSDTIKPPLRPKDQMREDLELQKREYLARGRKIQVIPEGKSALPDNFKDAFKIAKGVASD